MVVPVHADRLGFHTKFSPGGLSNNRWCANHTLLGASGVSPPPLLKMCLRLIPVDFDSYTSQHLCSLRCHNYIKPNGTCLNLQLQYAVIIFLIIGGGEDPLPNNHSLGFKCVHVYGAIHNSYLL